ncbi:asparagine synthase (glutamine-hydrolyzing) [Nibrella saemangeumensis]|uniref:asparagine synthase (glutamine-hydrolyzing) n=2 Tax=Nibrella saemangeumensis TaxID=1084526 RepID=A0ABP8MZW9_9BACT
MTNAVRHRGPDAEGYLIEQQVALGHRRLSIIDTSSVANQPLYDGAKRYALIFNGEIYNYRELRSQLEPGYAFRTESDSEVILAAFIRWGERCVSHFNGIFAFAIYDTVDQRLFLGRDRLGVKPLYYYQDDQVFLLASEVRAILRSGMVPKKLSMAGLTDYLAYQSVHEPHTIVDRIYQLPSGTCAWVDTRHPTLTLHTYWTLKAFRPAPVQSLAEVERQVADLVSKAVERQMMSDVPIGAFLSGGVDSTAIVGLMAQCTEQPINTVNLSFKEDQYDESQYAVLAARRFNTRHHTVTLSAQQLREELPIILKSIDRPSSDGVNTYMVSKYTKEAGLTVALSGLGGDELFAGYPSFKYFYDLYSSRLLWRTPRLVRQLAGSSVGLLSANRYDKLKTILATRSRSIGHMYPPIRRLFQKDVIEALTGIGDQPDFAATYLSADDTELGSMPVLSQFSVAEIATYTESVLLKDSDQMSMVHALELRVPFFDHELVDYALSIPDVYKYPGSPKQLLVNALRDILPEAIRKRPKQGFELPWTYWMKNELREFCHERLTWLGQTPYFRAEVIDTMWDKFLRGSKRVIWLQIWALVVLAEWIKENGIE